MNHAQVHAWLAARSPQRPAALAARMAELIDAGRPAPPEASRTMAETLSTLGLQALAGVTAAPPGARIALDLLAADAFVTYAFEAASEEGEDVAPLVARLLREAA